MHNLVNSDIRSLVGARQTVNADTWVAIDRYLNARFSRGSSQKGYEAWLSLPRGAMVEGGEALATGLKDYQAWADKHMSMNQQLIMLAHIVLDERERMASPASVSLGRHLTHWLSITAAEDGLSLEDFVTQKLSMLANGKRDAAINELVSG